MAISLEAAAGILAERAEKKSDNTFIKEMKDLIIIKRARIIANSLSKMPSLDRFYLQSFRVDLIPVDITDECSDEVAECCDKAFKSNKVVPQPIRYGVHPFTYVGSPGGSKAYGWTTMGTEPFLKKSPLTGKNPRHTYLDQYIYVFNKEIEYIRTEGVFSDPRDVATFKTCDGKKVCYSDQQEFPIDSQNLELILKDILTNELRLKPNNEENIIKADHNE